MNSNEIEILSSPEAEELLRVHFHENSSDFALKNPKIPHVGLIASQLELRQRAAKKLPAWAARSCLFTRKSLEQSTSEKVASVKPFGKGELAIDLSCGLGVDAVEMSRTYTEVIAVEPDPELCALAAYNFRQLGIGNIEIVNTTAEKFVTRLKEYRLPFIYLDPARRDEKGSRVHALAQTSPDYFSLEKDLLKHASFILLKTSPMFDFREGLRKINHVKSVTVISVSDECREILYEIVLGWDSLAELNAIAIHGKKIFRASAVFQSGKDYHVNEATTALSPGKYLLEPDVAFTMLGIESENFIQNHPGCRVHRLSPGGYFFSENRINSFAGKIYVVQEILPYKPSLILKMLKEKGLERVNLGRKNFRIPFSQVRKELKIKEGGEAYLLLTTTSEGDLIALLCQRLPEES